MTTTATKPDYGRLLGANAAAGVRGALQFRLLDGRLVCCIGDPATTPSFRPFDATPGEALAHLAARRCEVEQRIADLDSALRETAARRKDLAAIVACAAAVRGAFGLPGE